jgi:hypothetical protein
MKKIICISACCLSFLAVTAQQTVNSAYAAGNGCEVSLGEAVTGDIAGSDGQLTQGFLQGVLTVSQSSINKTLSDGRKLFILYPNPVESVLNAKCQGNVDAVFCLYSASGAFILRQALQQQTTSIDLSSIPAGIYVARIISSDNKNVYNETKIIKH